MAKPDVSFGGQAVIEGVLMRSPNFYSVATLKGKKIKVMNKFSPMWNQKKFLNWPIIRGAVGMLEMLRLGLSALTYSANEAADEDEQLSTAEIIYSFIFAFVLGIVFFVLAPLYISKLLVSTKGALFDIVDGVIRALFFFAYLYFIQKSKDVRRVFEFHGAEHATINAYEAKKKLTPANVKRFATFHPRCGTSFVLIVLVVSIIVFSFIRSESLIDKFVWRIILIPLVAGISYEFLKLSAKLTGRLASVMNFPGRMVQKVTTKRPDEWQIKAAIAALNSVIAAEKRFATRRKP